MFVWDILWQPFLFPQTHQKIVGGGSLLQAEVLDDLVVVVDGLEVLHGIGAPHEPILEHFLLNGRDVGVDDFLVAQIVDPDHLPAAESDHLFDLFLLLALYFYLAEEDRLEEGRSGDKLASLSYRINTEMHRTMALMISPDSLCYLF